MSLKLVSQRPCLTYPSPAIIKRNKLLCHDPMKSLTSFDFSNIIHFKARWITSQKLFVGCSTARLETRIMSNFCAHCKLDLPFIFSSNNYLNLIKRRYSIYINFLGEMFIAIVSISRRHQPAIAHITNTQRKNKA